MKSFLGVSLGLATLFACSLALLPGCEDSTRTTTIGRPEFSIKSSAREIMAGEIVTLTTRSANTAGRPSQIEWSTTGGELSTEDNGQVARVRFDRPGTYTVTGRLVLDHELVESDSATIKVKSLQR